MTKADMRYLGNDTDESLQFDPVAKQISSCCMQRRVEGTEDGAGGW